jgi:hypothetical protein
MPYEIVSCHTDDPTGPTLTGRGHKAPVQVGATYGSWTVLNASESCKKSGRTRVYYDCRCNCGLEQSVRSDFLRDDRKPRYCRQCRSRIDGEKKRCEPLLVGTIIGYWTVLGVSSPSKAQVCIYYDCQCRCGQIVSVKGHSLRNNETRQCRSCALRSRVLTKFSSKRLPPYQSVFNVFRKFATTAYPYKASVEFSLCFDDFLTLIGTSRCYYCWTPLVWAKHTARGKPRNYQIDRKDNSLGYTPENTVACCKRCNYSKREFFTYREWFGMTEYFRTRTL